MHRLADYIRNDISPQDDQNCSMLDAQHESCCPRLALRCLNVDAMQFHAPPRVFFGFFNLASPRTPAPDPMPCNGQRKTGTYKVVSQMKSCNKIRGDCHRRCCCASNSVCFLSSSVKSSKCQDGFNSRRCSLPPNQWPPAWKFFCYFSSSSGYFIPWSAARVLLAPRISMSKTKNESINEVSSS